MKPLTTAVKQSRGTVAITKVCITMGLLPRPLMLRNLGFSQATVKRMVNRNPMMQIDTEPMVKVDEVEEVEAQPSSPAKVQMQQMHTCWEYMEDYDCDGPTPGEYCEVCQAEMREYNRKAQLELRVTQRVQDTFEWQESWLEMQEDRNTEKKFYETYDAMGLMNIDIQRGTTRPWWFYEDMIVEGRKTPEEREEEAKKELEEFKAFKLLQEEHGYWFEPEEVKKAKAEEAKRIEKELKEYRNKLAGIEAIQMSGDAREYIRSVDRRKGEEKEAEFEEWLAIPKNKRPIFLEKGKKGPAVAKADIGSSVSGMTQRQSLQQTKFVGGSVVIKSCPPTVLLSDIRLVLARFGGVRDVYRPKDRATGKAKPFVFVEMLKNAEAWAAVDHFAEYPFVLDGNTFVVEGAGERKTSEEMAAGCAPHDATKNSVLGSENLETKIGFQDATVVAAVVEEPKKAPKKEKKPATGAFAEQTESARLALPYTGAFAALMDSDSDSDTE